MNLRREFLAFLVKNSQKFSEFCYDFGKYPSCHIERSEISLKLKRDFSPKGSK